MPWQLNKIVRNAISLLILFCCSPILKAQTVFQGSIQDELKPLATEEVGSFLDAFRHNTVQSNYSLRFSLKKIPRRGPSVYYYGTLWGILTDAGPLTRIRIWKEDNSETVEFLLQNGPEPRAWISQDNQTALEMTESTLLKPILDDLEYSAFDFLMPFLYWKDITYEGTKRIKSRKAHVFLLKEATALPVRLFIDASYKSLLKVEILNAGGNPLKTFKINDFKKIDNEWIVKSIDLVSEQTHNKTRFEITEAAFNLNISPHYLSPECLGDEAPLIDSHYYKNLH